ncbi:MAG: hypothetical protein LQ348_002223 [Seirophora lacunosa]|nr:MAG: hypothetical protein LQ348_002223 [Seirophora lacunosa]
MALLLLVYFLLPHLVLSSPLTSLSLNPGDPVSSNSTSAGDGLRASPVDCGAARFGANVRLRSIRNALAKIPNDRSRTTFERRQSGTVPEWYTELPYRIISDDGLAFIQIATRNNEQTDDNASWQEIRAIVSSIIQICVSQSGGQGGRVTAVGAYIALPRSQVLALGLSRPLLLFADKATNARKGFMVYSRAVRPAPYASCTSLLAQLPWDERVWIWSSQFQPFAPVFKLPLALFSGEKCLGF